MEFIGTVTVFRTLENRLTDGLIWSEMVLLNSFSAIYVTCKLCCQ